MSAGLHGFKHNINEIMVPSPGQESKALKSEATETLMSIVLGAKKTETVQGWFSFAKPRGPIKYGKF